ncbi:hypothetical protein J3Q64DRAFT_1396674 [Phycomyces blakesleeanus]|uniref:Uncharacterized protein n=1 Tax=Phycomyces blakesleeanus TaxID=4837 RepID=A0ABR3B6B8_PHYBL
MLFCIINCLSCLVLPSIFFFSFSTNNNNNNNNDWICYFGLLPVDYSKDTKKIQNNNNDNDNNDDDNNDDDYNNNNNSNFFFIYIGKVKGKW